ncbi:hypothetical protein [Streptomyces aureoversilis]|uniref:Uncharacterized protein n=1 Tax=Streptomyces aureoversilis TaxID=67277 RepID=A0ABW0A8Q6_9ACTN
MAPRKALFTFLAAAAARACAAGPAAAAPAQDASAPGAVPPCVSTEHYNDASGKVAWVWNACGNTQKARVVIGWGPDSDCFTIPPGTGAAYHYTFGNYGTTETC